MLREPVPLVPPADLGRVHFIAVGGSGMSGVARLCLDLGLEVSGSDQADSPELRALRDLGARVWVGHDAARMGRPDTVVFSSAIQPDNPEFAAAAAMGARLWHRSAALAALMLGRRGVAVAGTHGKTTTSGMVVAALQAAGLDPGYVIGSPLAATGEAAGLGGGDVFVVEADESDGTFLQYPAEVAVITNIDVDHLDNWGTPENYRAGFGRFVRGETVRWVVANADDDHSAELVARLEAEAARRASLEVEAATGASSSDPPPPRTTGAASDGGPVGPVAVFGALPDDVALRVPGEHNRSNAGLALATGLVLGGDRDRLLEGLAGFQGTARRFEPKGEVGGVAVFDDYAHHPKEIEATLRAARSLEPARVLAAFQPHLFSRTRDFAAEFGSALARADFTVVTDVYPAREQPIPGVTGELVADAVADAGGAVTYVADLAGVAPALAALARPGDLVLTLGAGSVTAVGAELVALLEGR